MHGSDCRRVCGKPQVKFNSKCRLTLKLYTTIDLYRTESSINLQKRINVTFLQSKLENSSLS